MDYQRVPDLPPEIGKTQKQLSELLGTSLKAIQSFEQGWRKVPVHIERQMLFLLTLKKKRKEDAGPAGKFGTVLWKDAVTARRGNSMRAVSAGLSMGPFVRENLKPTGAAR